MMKRLIKKIFEFYRFWISMGAKEIAAGFAYYFIIGFIPAFVFLLSAFNGKFSVDLLASPLIPGNVLSVLQSIVKRNRVDVGGSIFFVVTALYSSVNLFLRFKKCGELLFKVRSGASGLMKGILSFMVLGITFSIFVVANTIYITLCRLLNGMLSFIVLNLCIIVISFVVVLIMNYFICPYKTKLMENIHGIILTVILWVIVSALYTLYLNYFADYERFYGVIGVFISFMIYVYLVMQIFTIGVVFNISLNQKNQY